MSAELDRAYDALQQAHDAGNKEHAEQIADYIRTLQTEQPTEEAQPQAENEVAENRSAGLGEVAAGGAGVVLGGTLGKSVSENYAKDKLSGIKDTMQTSISGAKANKAATVAEANALWQEAREKAMAKNPAATPSAAAAKPGKTSTGATENWARAEHSGEFYGGRDYAEADAAAKEAKAFNKSSGAFRVPEGGETRLALPIDIRAKPVVEEVIEAAPAANPSLEKTVAAGAKQRAVDMARLVEAQQIADARKVAEEAQSKIVAKPGRMMGSLGGAEVLTNAEGLYRHGSQKDIPAAVANAIGVGGGLAALTPFKKIRGAGALIGALAPVGAEMVAKKAEGGVVNRVGEFIDSKLPPAMPGGGTMQRVGDFVGEMVPNKLQFLVPRDYKAARWTPEQEAAASAEMQRKINAGIPLPDDISNPKQQKYFAHMERDFMNKGKSLPYDKPIWQNHGYAEGGPIQNKAVNSVGYAAAPLVMDSLDDMDRRLYTYQYVKGIPDTDPRVVNLYKKYQAMGGDPQEGLARVKQKYGLAEGGEVSHDSLLDLLMNPKKTSKPTQKKAKGGVVNLAGGGPALALDLAKKLAPKFSLEAIKAMPVSSAAKQVPVARAFERLSKENVDPAIKKQIFEQYLSANPDMVRKSGATNYDELTHAAYDRLGHETKQQYEAMRNAGMNVDFDPTGAKSYKNSQEMLKDALENKHLDVFSGGDLHELLGENNNLFRATHDFFGHGTTGSSFGPKGEELAYGAHSQMYSPLAQLAAAAETRGQNSVVNYGGMNDELIKQMARAKASGASPEDLRALGGQWQYAPQKALILPPEHVDINYSGYAAGGEVAKKALEHAKRIMFTHYSPHANLTKLDPLKYGTGMKGAEAERLAEMPELKPRSYFYHGEKIVPESGVGGNKYSGVSERSYSLGEDPAGFSAEASLNAYDPYLASKGINQFSQKMYYNNLEKKIKDAGFSGYHSDNTGVLFEPTDVFKVTE